MGTVGSTRPRTGLRLTRESAETCRDWREPRVFGTDGERQHVTEVSRLLPSGGRGSARLLTDVRTGGRTLSY